MVRETRICGSDLVGRLIVSAGRRVGPASKEGLRGVPRAVSVVSQNLRPLQGAGSILLHYVTRPFEDMSDGSAVGANYTRAQMLHTRAKSDKAEAAENAQAGRELTA